MGSPARKGTVPSDAISVPSMLTSTSFFLSAILSFISGSTALINTPFCPVFILSHLRIAGDSTRCHENGSEGNPVYRLFLS